MDQNLFAGHYQRSEATLKIRSFCLEIVDFVFADDDFNLLDDQLRADFSVRRAELMARSPPKAATVQGSNIWILIIALSILLSISFSASSKQQYNGGYSPNPSLNQ